MGGKMNTEKINLYTQISASDDIECTLSVKNASGIIGLDRLGAIKLRNFLNKFINGDFVEEEEPEVEETPKKEEKKETK